jgi:long-chain acyl-CoA synthetase
VEWLIADAGCMMYGFVTVTVHYTFPEDDTDFVVEQANIKAIITSSGLLPRVCNSPVVPFAPLVFSHCALFYLQFGRSAQKHKHLHYIVQLDGEQVSEEHLKEFGNDVKILHITEVEKLGAENPHNIVLPDPNALFTVMYTSGSTGRPKVRSRR